MRFDKQADSLFPNGGSDGGLELSGETDYCFLSRQTVVRTTEVLVTGGLCPKDSALLSFFVQHPTVSGLSSKKIRVQSVSVNSPSLGHSLKTTAMSPLLCNAGRYKGSQPQPKQWQEKDCLHMAFS